MENEHIRAAIHLKSFNLKRISSFHEYNEYSHGERLALRVGEGEVTFEHLFNGRREKPDATARLLEAIGTIFNLASDVDLILVF